LGHQLLAEALGGSVGPAETPEIGVLEVQLTEAGAQGVFFDGLPEQFKCLQWHSSEVIGLPSDAEVLASSADCTVQALKWGTRAYSVQFHLEVEQDTVENWAKISAYSDVLESVMGKGGVEALSSNCKKQISDFNNNAERVYLNWMQTSAHT